MVPVDPGSLVGIAKFLQTLFAPFKWVADQIHLRYFRFRSRWPWLDKDTAIKRARLSLGLRVVDAIAFQNFKSPRKYIAALTEESPDSYLKQVFLLEKLGGGYVVVWKSDEIRSSLNQIFSIDDIEQKGSYFITFNDESWGSGMGSRILHSYSAVTNELSTIEEQYNYSNSVAPEYEPEVKTSGDEKFRYRFIQFATCKGFLKEIELPNLENPEWATHRWHYDNSNWFIQGNVIINRYAGLPIYGDGSMKELETDKSKWVAYFKGPLFKIDKEKDEHYIVYSPLNRYEWVKALAGNDEVLFFSCHCLSGLFLYKESDKSIARYCDIVGRPIPIIDSMHMEGSELVLLASEYPENPIRIRSMNQLNQCENWCKLLETHSHRECKDQLFIKSEQELLEE